MRINNCYVSAVLYKARNNDAVRLTPGSIPWGIRCEQREEGRVEET